MKLNFDYFVITEQSVNFALWPLKSGSSVKSRNSSPGLDFLSRKYGIS